MLRFLNIATNAAVEEEKLNVRTFIFPGPSASRARVRCTSCTHLS